MTCGGIAFARPTPTVERSKVVSACGREPVRVAGALRSAPPSAELVDHVDPSTVKEQRRYGPRDAIRAAASRGRRAEEAELARVIRRRVAFDEGLLRHMRGDALTVRRERRGASGEARAARRER